MDFNALLSRVLAAETPTTRGSPERVVEIWLGLGN